MKKIITWIVCLFVVCILLFYFLYYKKNSINIKYEEPVTKFFDESLVSSNDIVVKITDDGFEPETINIKKGGKVTWVNKTSGYSWPASNPHPAHTDFPEFDPQLPMKKGQAWSFTFDKVGKWGYHDHLNPTKRGIVYVE